MKNKNEMVKHCPRNLLTAAFIIFGIAVLIGLPGCGSDDDSNTQTPAVDEPVVETRENESFEKAMKYALASIDENAKSADDIGMLKNTTNYLESGAPDNSGRRDFSASFQCGSLSIGDRILEYTFTPNEGCGDISGTVKMTVDQENGENLEWDLEYIGLNIGDCVIDGLVHYSLDYEDNTVTGQYACENLTICGKTYDDTASFTLTGEDGVISYHLASEQYEYEGSIEVETTIDVSADDEIDSVNGTATVNINGEIYTCNVEALVIDPECGLPYSGSLTITGADGNTMVTDFTGVSCDNPVVSYTLNGIEYTYRLDNA